MTTRSSEATVWVAGIGCRRDCPAIEIRALLDAALAECGLAATALTRLASIEQKTNEPGLQETAAALGLSLSCWPGAILQQYEHRLGSHSPTVRAATGTSGVAEAAALAEASGGDPADPCAELVLNRRSSARATVAIACRRSEGNCSLSIE